MDVKNKCRKVNLKYCKNKFKFAQPAVAADLAFGQVVRRIASSMTLIVY